MADAHRASSSSSDATAPDDAHPIAVGGVRPELLAEVESARSSVALSDRDRAENSPHGSTTSLNRIPHDRASAHSSVHSLGHPLGSTSELNRIRRPRIGRIGHAVTHLKPKKGRKHRYDVKKKRYEKIETVLKLLLDETKGPVVKDRKKMLNTIPNCFVASELLDKLVENGGFYTREEALQFSRYMLQDGYIYPVEISNTDLPPPAVTAVLPKIGGGGGGGNGVNPGNFVFNDDSTLFRYQEPRLWLSRHKWVPNDLDYVLYLNKRALRATGKKRGLEKYELDRLEKYQKKYQAKWEAIVQEAKSLVDKEAQLGRSERKTLEAQEMIFWWALKRPEDFVHSFHDLEEKYNDRPANLTEDDIESDLQNELLLEYLANKKLMLQLQNNTNSMKTSTAFRSLRTFCEVEETFDPFLSSRIPNAYASKDLRDFRQQRSDAVTKEDIRRWSKFMKDVLQDPLGMELFKMFLRTEFSQENLNFYLVCQELDLVESREEFVASAVFIYKAFLAADAPHELNVDAAKRNAVRRKFEQEGEDGFPAIRPVDLLTWGRHGKARWKPRQIAPLNLQQLLEKTSVMTTLGRMQQATVPQRTSMRARNLAQVAAMGGGGSTSGLASQGSLTGGGHSSQGSNLNESLVSLGPQTATPSPRGPPSASAHVFQDATSQQPDGAATHSASTSTARGSTDSASSRKLSAVDGAGVPPLGAVDGPSNRSSLAYARPTPEELEDDDDLSLDENCFEEVNKAIFMLMSKDSYPRFLVSRFCREGLTLQDVGTV